MPRVHRKGHLLKYGLDQEQALVQGDLGCAMAGRPMLPGGPVVRGQTPIFGSVEEMAHCWRTHRDVLMGDPESNGPGHRPVAHFVFDLGIPETQLGRWRYTMPRILLQHGEIDEPEAAAIEKQEPWLRGGPDRDMTAPATVLKFLSQLSRARLGLAWARFRKRPEDAAAWAAVVRTAAEKATALLHTVVEVEQAGVAQEIQAALREIEGKENHEVHED